MKKINNNVGPLSARIAGYVDAFSKPEKRLGVSYIKEQGCFVRLWSPSAHQVMIEWVDHDLVALKKQDEYFTGFFPYRKPGDKYWFHRDGMRMPDPASRYQPEGAQGPSMVVAFEYPWNDQNWSGVPFENWVIYEIHTGTFSETHDFDGIVKDLPRLKDLGVTTLELMPVAQFSGTRNWGYDGVFPNAVQHTYGGPEKLKALVDACHAHGLAVVLDVVYNHLGIEGNVLFDTAPYATDRYRLPWGKAINYDGEFSPEVRRYFLQNAWQWLTEYHFDGLRLDAIQMIFDTAPISFLQELSLLRCESEKIRDQKLVLIGEIDTNDPRVLMPIDRNGLELDAHWADDLHHALHAILTGERNGYYVEYGSLEQLERIYQRGVASEGDYSSYRKAYRGGSYDGIDKKRLIVESQNHDQIGNRLKGERLITLTNFEKAKLAAGCVLLSPFTPFLFMGEEFACTQPFLFFADYQDEELKKKIRESRKEEWKSFGWKGEVPDPTADQTFLQCILKDELSEDYAVPMTEYYKELIALSKSVRTYDLDHVQHDRERSHIILSYKKENSEIGVLLSFNDKPEPFTDIKEKIILQSAYYSPEATLPAEGMVAPWSVTVWGYTNE